MEGKLANVDRLIAGLATRAHGLVTRKGLLAAGVSSGQIEARLASGALIAVLRGVYRVGHAAPNLEAHYLAAVLACGEGALLAGVAAAHLRGLVRGGSRTPEAVTTTARHVEGIVTRLRPELARSEASSCRGVPTLTPAAVLVELAAVLPRAELAAACHEAGVRYDVTPRDVARILERYPRSRGAAELRRVVSGEARVTLSRVESKLLERLSGADLPLPVTNRPAGVHRVDCRWPDFRLTVELDSYRYHRSRQAWERDRLREREARLRGDEFRRYTWNDVMNEPDWMLRELMSLLGPSRRAAPPRARAA